MSYRVSTVGGLRPTSFTLLPSAVERAVALLNSGYPAFIKRELRVVELKRAVTGGGLEVVDHDDAPWADQVRYLVGLSS